MTMGGFTFMTTACGVTPQAPEHRDFTLPDLHRIAEIRMIQVADADHFGAADVERRTVYLGIAAGNRNGLDHLLMRNGAHADHRGARESSCRPAGDVCDIHGDVAAHFHMPDADALIQKSGFKSKAASDEKAHKIIPPKGGNVGIFSRADAVFINAI